MRARRRGGKAAAALGVLPWLLDDCARRGLRVGPLAEHAADAAARMTAASGEVKAPQEKLKQPYAGSKG
jgi:hypothetical protein